ncbi:MAG TPA: hypothetical protein VMF35_10530 [Acidimicrobiales bacterium]|nr:hypothetical protein [Acidimicrobiales bacterium]
MRRERTRFARLLWAYPRSYRERRGDEILGTLLEGAPDRGSFETARVASNVVAHGVRLRVGIASDQAAGRILAAAALPGLAMAAAVALVMGWFAFLLPGIRHDPVSFGIDTALWPIVYLVWVLGAASALAFPRRKRVCAAGCVLASVAVPLLLPEHNWPRLPAISLLIALAVPALLAPATSPRRSHRGLALFVGAASLGTLGAAAASSAQAAIGGPFFYLGFGTLAPYVAWMALGFSAALLVARRWIHAAALALLAVPWLVFAFVDQQPFGGTPAYYAVWIEFVCALAAGLLGTWASRLTRTPEAIY